MPSCRYTPGQTIQGILILEILSPSTTYDTVIYKVRYACGHIEKVTGRALVTKIHNLLRNKATNLCSVCGQKAGRQRTTETMNKRKEERKKQANNPPPVISWGEVFRNL